MLASLTPDDKARLLHHWPFWARPEQLTPDGDTWNVWLILSGRGWGKTRTGAEDVKAFGLAHPESRIAIVAPTFADARDTCVEGDSGLLSVLPRGSLRKWNRTLGEVELTNGTHYKLFSAAEPDRLRGPQHHRAWCDELAAWKYLREAWDQLMFGLRLGAHPQTVCTTTPRPVSLIHELLERGDVHITRGMTFDNADNLAAPALASLQARYAGTRLGRQELYGEVLSDTPGALWKRDQIEAQRVSKLPDLARIVVAIDPAVTSGEGSDETGVIVAALGVDGQGYVLDDRSMRASPDRWAREAIAAYHSRGADRIVAEVNQGGDLVELTIRTVDRSVAYKAVRASHGKTARAEPVAALYEQGRIHHVGTFPELEDQLTTWTQGEASPDRLDALVWAFTELMLSGREPRVRFFDSPRGALPPEFH